MPRAVPPDDGAPVTLIALVASAGGLEAIAATLEDLPEDLPAAIVVLIHQEPGRPDAVLGDLLARRSALPVAVAVDGDGLRPGTVAVVPPGTHALVTCDRRLSLIEAGDFPPHRPSADLLLASMATALGSGAVAVVLSGGGHDGATGATAVHVHGGTVLATSEATSAVFSMPDATIRRDHAIDAVVDLADLPGALVPLVADREAARSAGGRRAAPDPTAVAESEIADAVSRLYKEHLGRGPTRARTTLAHDVVVCVVEGIALPLERTLVERGAAEIADRARGAAQQQLSTRMAAAVEAVTGRGVRSHVSGTSIEDGAATEVFLLTRADR